MSEKTVANDVSTDVSHASHSLKEKAIELPTNMEVEEKSNPVLASDALDDSSSSYCTAHCSLSEYSEAFEDETFGTGSPCQGQNTSSESSNGDAASAGTSKNSCSDNDDLLQDFKTKEANDITASWDDIDGEPLSGQNKTSLSLNNTFTWESKHFLSGPKITILNLNLTNINTVVNEQDCVPMLNSSRKESFLKPFDFRNKNEATEVGINPFQDSSSLKPSFNTSLTSEDYKYKKEGTLVQHSSIKMVEDPTTQKNFCRDYYMLSSEGKLNSSKSSIDCLKWKEEEQHSGVGKEQAELSFKAGNRKLPASSTSTLTVNKQKSGILPRCYSKRLLATSNQHQSQNHPAFQRLKKQNCQGVHPSSLLPPTPCSKSREHCGSAHNTSRALRMATKTETTADVRAFATLDHAKSCSESNYLDVLNSTCFSFQLPSEGDFHDWSKDVLSFKLPRISTDNHNTSAYSESSSIECIDVAWEGCEEMNRNAKMVPKRQIQLKKRESLDSHTSDDNVIFEVPLPSSRPRDILQRQHSTPAAFHQDSHHSETKSDQTERKQKLQKSLSLDETSSKNKKASCIIKSVLSKRMQHEQNLNSLDASDQDPLTACSTTNDGDFLSTSTFKEGCTQANPVNVPVASLLSCGMQKPTQKAESKTTESSIKEHTSVSSKTQPKLLTKHSFNPLLCGLNRTQFQGSGSEIKASSETEKEKLSPNKETCLFTSMRTEEKLSCDSAKGKAKNLSAVISETVGKQALVRTTLEKCRTVQGGQKQHFENQQTTSTEKQEKSDEGQNSVHSAPLDTCLSCNLDASTKGIIIEQCNLKKKQESDVKELRTPGQSAKMDNQSLEKIKAIAPVYVVRDMRSLVKNKNSQSFRCSGEKAQAGLPTATSETLSSKICNKEKRLKQDKKLQLQQVTPSTTLKKVRASLDTTSKGCAYKVTSILESHDKIPHTGLTKGVLVGAAQTNSHALSKSLEEQDCLTAISQADLQFSNTNIKQTGKPVPSHGPTATKMSKHDSSADFSKPDYEKPKNLVKHQRLPLAAESQNCLPADSSDKQKSCKPSKRVSSTANDCGQIPGPPLRSQSPPGPPSTCILTVAPTPVFPSYFYKPNPLGYQTVSPNMGAVSYIQGPILLQTPALNQPAMASGPVPFMRSLSVEGRLLSQPCSADDCMEQQGSSKQTENEDIKLKRTVPAAQNCTPFITSLGTEGIQGGVTMQNPDVDENLAQSPRHMLLDPETGHCFYVDMPQLPQRKMLFDPETCQYVEVLLLQQSTVMTSPCAIPFPSLHIPAMYAPHCLSYVQAHPQVLPPAEP